MTSAQSPQNSQANESDYGWPEEGEPLNDLPVDLGPLGINDIGYVCATKPRAYHHPDGGIQWETDHYVQRDRCPKELID